MSPPGGRQHARASGGDTVCLVLSLFNNLPSLELLIARVCVRLSGVETHGTTHFDTAQVHAVLLRQGLHDDLRVLLQRRGGD
jgi:hypothetical protein